MAAQKGRDLLLKVDTDGMGSFSTMAGMRSHTIALNAEAVDVTNAESTNAWRELLAGAGVKSVGVSGSGIFKDAATDATIRGYFFAGTVVDWQIIIPDFGTLQGLFQISSLEYAGEHKGEVAFELSLESAGPVAFTAI
ncbi:MAG: phage major tail protein, TP901-1 family [Alphaproteobacteria bacterium]